MTGVNKLQHSINSSRVVYQREATALASGSRSELGDVLRDHGRMIGTLFDLSKEVPLSHPSAHVVHFLLSRHLYSRAALRAKFAPDVSPPPPPPLQRQAQVFTLRTPTSGSWAEMPRNAETQALARALTQPLRQIPCHPRNEFGRLLMCGPDPGHLEHLVNMAADASSVPIVRMDARLLPSDAHAGAAVHSAFDCARDLVARKYTRRVMVVVAGAERLCQLVAEAAVAEAVRALVAEGIAAGPNISCVGVANTDVPMEVATLAMLWPYSNEVERGMIRAGQSL